MDAIDSLRHDVTAHSRKHSLQRVSHFERQLENVTQCMSLAASHPALILTINERGSLGIEFGERDFCCRQHMIGIPAPFVNDFDILMFPSHSQNIFQCRLSFSRLDSCCRFLKRCIPIVDVQNVWLIFL